jgi:DNA-binding response OmpR family regulator
VARILVYEPRRIHEPWETLLAGAGRDILVCGDPECFVSALSERRPDVLIYLLSDLDQDLAMLLALRRVSSTLPIILLDGPADLEARRSIQQLNPTYYGVPPFEESEISEVVRGALSRLARHPAV